MEKTLNGMKNGLCMMWPRLHLLKELLAEDGVIFISIDDNEQHHLRMLMDEIFDEKNIFRTNSLGKAEPNLQIWEGQDLIFRPILNLS